MISMTAVSQLPQPNTSVVAARRDYAALPTRWLRARPLFCRPWLLHGELGQGVALGETWLGVGFCLDPFSVAPWAHGVTT